MSSVIAIDTGKRNVGLAVFQGLEVVKCYLLNASSLSHHYYQFNSIIEEYNPDVVAFEKPFFSPSTMATGYEIIEVIGVEKLVLEQKQIEILEFPATTVKKNTGNGKNSKEQVKAFCMEFLNLEENFVRVMAGVGKKGENHVWDAIALGLLALERRNYGA